MGRLFVIAYPSSVPVSRLIPNSEVFAEVEIQIRQNLINQNLALIFEKLRSKAKINVKNFSEIREEARNASKNK